MRIANLLLATAVVSSVSAATVVQRGSEQKNLRFRKLPGRQRSKNKTHGGIVHTGPHVETTTDEQQKEYTKQRTGRGRGGRHRDGTIDPLTASLETESEQVPNQRKGGRPRPSGLEPRTKGLVDTDGSMPTKEQMKSQSTPKESRAPPPPKPEPDDTPVDTPEEDTPVAGGEGDSESESEPHIKGAHKGPKLSHEERAEKHMKKMEEKKAKKAGEEVPPTVDDATTVPPPIPEDTPVEDTPVEDEPDIVVDEPEDEPVPEAFGGELVDAPEEDNGTLDDVGGWELTNTTMPSFAPTLAPTWEDDESPAPTWVDVVEEEEEVTVDEEVPTTPEVKECPAAYDTTGATTYVGGDKVEVTSHIFECHSLYVDYCNVPEWDDSMGGEVEEQMWNDAWTYIEPCVIGE